MLNVHVYNRNATRNPVFSRVLFIENWAGQEFYRRDAKLVPPELKIDASENIVLRAFAYYVFDICPSETSIAPSVPTDAVCARYD